MALLFSSGGGRLGNQLLNMMHLMAISYEYDFKVERINDYFLESNNKSLKFSIERSKINWKVLNKFKKRSYIYKVLLNLYIYLVHFYYYLMPGYNSYTIGALANRPKYIIGKELGSNISIKKLINKAKKNNIVIAGWGLRDWDLVLKYKESIINNLLKSLDKLPTNNKNLVFKDFLFVHIRRTDFLIVDEFKEINFSDSLWLKSILKICFQNSIYKIVMFSDSIISKKLLNSLREKGIQIYIPNQDSENTFLSLFIKYIANAKYVLCNSSTLTLSLSYLFHQNIYIPSYHKDFDEILLTQAHNTYPTSLNWN